MDLGPCPKVHSLVLRKDYEDAKVKGMHNFDRELEDLIERLIMDCERKIQRALKRLENEDAKAAVGISVSQVTQVPEVMDLSKQINDKLKEVDAFDLIGETDRKIQAQEEIEELRVKRADKQAILLLAAFDKDKASLLQSSNNPPQLPAPNPPDPHTQEIINEKLKRAEDLGEQGMIDEAQKVLEEAEALKKSSTRQEPTPDSSKFTAADVRITDQKLRVCDICGAFLSVYDSDRRLADHFGGKLHLGYMQIREKLTEMQEDRIKSQKRERSEDRRYPERARSVDRRSREPSREDRRDSRERSREYDRHSREYDRNHGRELSYDHERDYGRSRQYDSRSRRRSRSHSRERSRDYDRHRRRDHRY